MKRGRRLKQGVMGWKKRERLSMYQSVVEGRLHSHYVEKRLMNAVVMNAGVAREYRRLAHGKGHFSLQILVIIS